jgi:hypothetical protein
MNDTEKGLHAPPAPIERYEVMRKISELSECTRESARATMSLAESVKSMAMPLQKMAHEGHCAEVAGLLERVESVEEGHKELKTTQTKQFDLLQQIHIGVVQVTTQLSERKGAEERLAKESKDARQGSQDGLKWIIGLAASVAFLVVNHYWK